MPAFLLGAIAHGEGVAATTGEERQLVAAEGRRPPRLRSPWATPSIVLGQAPCGRATARPWPRPTS
jgi:hypothetical protein